MVTIDSFVATLARTANAIATAEERTGVTHEEFWQSQEAALVAAMESGRYPHMADLSDDAFAASNGRTFEFGLQTHPRRRPVPPRLPPLGSPQSAPPPEAMLVSQQSRWSQPMAAVRTPGPPPGVRGADIFFVICLSRRCDEIEFLSFLGYVDADRNLGSRHQLGSAEIAGSRAARSLASVVKNQSTCWSC